MSTEESNQAQAFAKLFSEGQRIAFHKSVKSNPIFFTYPFQECPKDCQFLVLNPFQTEATERNIDNILYRQGITIEMDCVSLQNQRDWIKEILGCATVSNFSGNKSIHNHFIFSNPLTADEEFQIVELFKRAFPFADWQVISDKARLCRTPGAMRDNSKEQTIEFIGEKKAYAEVLTSLQSYTKSIKESPSRANQTMKKFWNDREKGKLHSKDETLCVLKEIVSDLLKCGYGLDTFLEKTLLELPGVTPASLREAQQQIEDSWLTQAVKEMAREQKEIAKSTKIQTVKSWKIDACERLANCWSKFYESYKIHNIKPARNGWSVGFTPGEHKNKFGGFHFREDNGYFVDFYSGEQGFPNRYLVLTLGISEQEAWKRIAEFAEIPAVDKCKYCQATIEWQEVNGKSQPVNSDGTPHQHKRIKGAKKVATEDPKIVEKEEQTFVVESTVNESTGELEITYKKVCNFIMRIEQKIYDDDRNVSWIVTLQNDMESARIGLSGEELTIWYKFAERIGKAGAFMLEPNSKSTHNIFVDHVLKSSESIKQKRKTQYLGRATQGRKAFVFCNAVAVPGGIEPLEGLLLPKSILRITMPEEPLAMFWKQAIAAFFAIYGSQAWKALGFAVASLFVDEIVDRFAGFPLLFINGGKGTGKNVLYEMILSFFGAQRAIAPLNFNSTNKSWYREAMKYRAIPLVLNEYQPTQKNNATVIAMFDRQGYTRAKTSNDLETQTTEVNSTIILVSTRDITGFESEAVTSRLIKIEMENIQRNAKTWEEVITLKKDISLLSSFVPQTLRIDAEKTLAKIEEEIHHNQSITNVEQRLIMTHSIVKVFANAFLETVNLVEQYGVGDIHREIEDQQQATNEANAANLFISILKAMIEKGEMPEKIAKIKDDQIIFRLSECYPYVRQFVSRAYEKEDLPDEKTLSKLLHGIGAIRKNSRELSGPPQKVWCLQIAE
jgi:hypothetical protein